MKNIHNFREILILLSIATALKVADTDASTIKNGSQQQQQQPIEGFHPRFRRNAAPEPIVDNAHDNDRVVFPDDNYKLQSPTDTLSVSKSPDDDYELQPRTDTLSVSKSPDNGSKLQSRKNTLSVYKEDWIRTPEPDNSDMGYLASKLSDFHKRLTSTILSHRPGENVLYSPFSVSTLVTLMAIGARSRTYSELSNSLGFEWELRTFNGMRELRSLMKDNDGVVFRFANKIFASSGIQLTDYFNRAANDFLDVRTKPVDFSYSENVADQINEWCKFKTDNHIKEIVKSDDLQDALMVLTNAIYFEGSWALPFNPNKTTTQQFYISKNKSIPVQMMNQQDIFNYGIITDLKAHYIELPYKHKGDIYDQFSMYLLVPIQKDGLDLIEKNLDQIDFNRLDSDPAGVDLTMPKFKIDGTVELKPVLEMMGIKRIFTNRADFSAMSNKHLHVSKIIQKSYLEVDEIGSKAAAATGTVFFNRGMMSNIRADKPFLCAIVIKRLGLPLFFARIADPTQFLS